MSSQTFTIDDKEVNIRFIKINQEIRLEAERVYAQCFNECLQNDIPLRIEVQRQLEEKGLLNQVNTSKAQKIRDELTDLHMKLYGAKNDDGSAMTRDEGRALALKMRDLRDSVNDDSNDLGDVFSHTAESKANNRQLLFYVYATTMNEDSGERYWKSFSDFENDASSPIVAEATKALLSNLAGVDKDFDKKLPENAWLIRMGYMNDKLQLVDSEGRLIDEEGRFINDKGRFINEDGDFVDRSGNLVDESGNLIVEDNWD